jgi:hypothetical protein
MNIYLRLLLHGIYFRRKSFADATDTLPLNPTSTTVAPSLTGTAEENLAKRIGITLRNYRAPETTRCKLTTPQVYSLIGTRHVRHQLEAML